jgi:hypothetical protein
MADEIKLVWKNVETGELIDGAVPFLPITRAVYAIKDNSGILIEATHEQIVKNTAHG